MSVESEAVKAFIEEQKNIDENEQLLLQAYRTLSESARSELLLYALKLKLKS